MFDWRALQRFKLDEGCVPPGSILLNHELDFLEAYGRYVIGGNVLILLQALVIGGLLWQRKQRTIGQTELIEEKQAVNRKLIRGQNRSANASLAISTTTSISALPWWRLKSSNFKLGVTPVRGSATTSSRKYSTKYRMWHRTSKPISHQLHSTRLEYLGLVPAVRPFAMNCPSGRASTSISYTAMFPPRFLRKFPSLSSASPRKHCTMSSNIAAQKRSRLVWWERMAKSNWLFAIQGWIRLGFGIEAAMDGPGLGLISIQERILSLNGSVSIVSKPGQGTEILVRVPVSDNMQPAAQN